MASPGGGENGDAEQATEKADRPRTRGCGWEAQGMLSEPSVYSLVSGLWPKALEKIIRK